MKDRAKGTKDGNKKEESVLEIANRVSERAEEGKQKDKRYNSFVR